MLTATALLTGYCMPLGSLAQESIQPMDPLLQPDDQVARPEKAGQRHNPDENAKPAIHPSRSKSGSSSKSGLRSFERVRIPRPTKGKRTPPLAPPRKSDNKMPPLAPSIVPGKNVTDAGNSNSARFSTSHFSIEAASRKVDADGYVIRKKNNVNAAGARRPAWMPNSKKTSPDSTDPLLADPIKSNPRIPRPTYGNSSIPGSATEGSPKAESREAASANPTTTASGSSITGAASSATGSSPDPLLATPSDSSSSSPAVDNYPKVGELEVITFGRTRTDQDIVDRLSGLENAIFARSFNEDSLFDRTERLKRTLLGAQAAAPAAVPATDLVDTTMTAMDTYEEDLKYLDEMAMQLDNLKAVPKNILGEFAVELINYERKKRSLAPLEFDPVAQKLADSHLTDMIARGVVTHINKDGHNPDRRYTLMGGVDAVTESLVSVSTAELGTSNLTKAAFCKMLKTMLKRQDDREVLFAPESTHIAVAMDTSIDKTKVLGCLEIVTKRGVIHPLKTSAKVGEKLEVEGIIFKPYRFDRITVAWEGLADSPVEEDITTGEALPYFPPLDFIAYKQKSEKDYSKAIIALKALGMAAAIAGGMFVPPVALAAPLIMMSGPSGTDLKPQSDIPVKGGVKVSGATFSGRVHLDNNDQEGLYYITVWASLGQGSKAIAISRRTILATEDGPSEEDSSKQKGDSIEYTKGDDSKDSDRKKQDRTEADPDDDEPDDRDEDDEDEARTGL